MKNSWKAPVAGALLVLLTVTLYLPALRFGFVWDDDDHLTTNPAMTSVEGLKQIWSSLSVSRYYPLTLTSFWMQRRLWGLQPLFYHAVNIALQAANAVLLWVLLQRLQIRCAWMAAALWAVHPVNIETVVWVTELKNLQSGLFFLLALLFFFRFEDEQHPGDYVATLMCGAAAMLSKPSTVVLPAVMLLCAWWRRGRWTPRCFLQVAPFAAFGVGMSLLTIVEQRRMVAIPDTSGWTPTMSERLVLAGRAVWFYAGKLLWPTNLSFIYPHWDLQAHSIGAWVPLAGLAAIAGILWRFRRESWARATTFALGYFVVALLPVLGFFDIYYFRYSYVADHFQYLAGIGLIALAVNAGAMVFQRFGRRGRELGILAAAIVLLLLGTAAWGQAHVYHNSETLWRDTLAKNPTAWLAQNNLGSLLRQAGKPEEAIHHYELALRIRPDFAEAHYNLGVTLARLNRFQEAIEHYEQALRLKPDFAEARYNLGISLAELGRVPEAVEQWKQALRLKPDYAEAHFNLGLMLAAQGQATEALEHYRTAVDLANKKGDATLADAVQSRIKLMGEAPP
jgi:tetratricopeptide (TPR) repeat protein